MSQEAIAKRVSTVHPLKTRPPHTVRYRHPVPVLRSCQVGNLRRNVLQPSHDSVQYRIIDVAFEGF